MMADTSRSFFTPYKIRFIETLLKVIQAFHEFSSVKIGKKMRQVLDRLKQDGLIQKDVNVMRFTTSQAGVKIPPFAKPDDCCPIPPKATVLSPDPLTQ